MRTTLNIDDQLLEEARRITGMKEKTMLVREGLRSLIERGSEPQLQAVSRHRPMDFSP